MENNQNTSQKHFYEQVRDNQWFMQTKLLRIGFGGFSVPASVFPFLLLMLVHSAFGFVIALIVVMHITKIKTGVSPGHYGRWMRKAMNNGITHAHPLSRKRTLLSVGAMMFILVLPATPSVAYADIRLILPPAKQGNQRATVKREGVHDVPLLKRGIIMQGFAIDQPLEDVMRTLQLQTWVVKFRDPELKNLNVSWRSVDMDLIDIYQDLAERYSITFRYSNRTGEMFVEFTDAECVTGYDKAGIFKLIC